MLPRKQLAEPYRFASTEITPLAGITSYRLPYPAIVGIHMAFLNGVKTTVSIAGNVVTATQFVPAEYTAKDELEVFFFI